MADADPPPDGWAEPAVERNLLDHYFAAVYNKLEAEALLFNRRLPHAGLVGAENERAIADVLREFLPPRYGIEVNAIIIDRFGKTSKQTDIVIFDAEKQAKFFRKVFPVEMVYAAIEVKTSMGSSEAASALENLTSVNELEFRPALAPYWETRTGEETIYHSPPRCYVFAYRTNCGSFETFARWFPWEWITQGVKLREGHPHREIRTLNVCALDQGTIQMESSNGFVQRMLAEATDGRSDRVFDTSFRDVSVAVDPAKALFYFLHRVWSDLQNHHLHPGFDIRSYLSRVLGTYIPVSDTDLVR